MGPGLIVGLVLYIFGFAFFTYVCIVADPEDSKLANYMTRQLPSIVSGKVEKLVGPTILSYLNIILDHALVLVYLVLVLGSWSVMLTFGYAWITESQHVSNLHKYSGYILFLICMSSWRYASNQSPGIITVRTLEKFDNFPYDNLLFVPNRTCPTVGIRKLARSKYDRFSSRNGHVARFDHYCGWLHQPVGEENYRYFLWFLLVHVVMCAYGTYVTFYLFHGEMMDRDLLNATFVDITTGQEVKSNWKIAAHFLLRQRFEMACVLALMGTMTVVLGGFLGFHIYITSKGMTTNELSKWKQVKKWHKQELQRYRHAIKDGKISKNEASKKEEPSLVVSDDGAVGCTGGTTENTQSTALEQEHPPSIIMDPGPMPNNMYDNGLVENWKEVIFPRSLRKDALTRWAKSLENNNNYNNNSMISEMAVASTSTSSSAAVVDAKGKPKAH